MRLSVFRSLPSRCIVGPSGRPHRGRAGVTLLEVMTAVIVISILLLMAVPLFNSYVGRSQKVKCIGNLRSLHVATTTYIRDTQHWPQLTPATHGDTVAAQAWIDTFRPYGLQQINWICPAIQRALQSPDLTRPDQVRVDYFGTSFNTKPNSPFMYPRQPWYAENADVHGNGQEILFPDGHIEEAGDLTVGIKPPPSPGAGH